MGKKIIFLGSYIGNKFGFLKENYYKNESSLSNSEYERTLYSGFLKNGADCIFISAPSVGKWPKNCKKPYLSLKSDNAEIKFCNYLTIYGISNISKQRSLLKEFKKAIRKEKNNKIVVVACEAHLPYLKVLKYAAKKNIQTSLIVPDLPENVIYSKNPIYKFLKQRNVLSIYKLADKYVNSFLFFTNPMKDKFSLNNKSYLVREGIIDEESITNINSSSQNIISYIGKTNKSNGLELIAKTAKLLPEYEFHIYGNGNMDSYLEKNKSSNLVLHGFCDPNSIDQILQNSNVLLSPRFPDETRTKYSFPSKIFKYISSNKPIVTFKLPCYSNDFDKVFFYPKDSSPGELSNSIKKAISSRTYYEKILAKYSSKQVAKDYLNILE